MKFGQKESRLKRGDASSGSPRARSPRNGLCYERLYYITLLQKMQQPLGGAA